MTFIPAACPGCVPGGRDDEHLSGCDFGPDAWKSHRPGCTCPDCEESRKPATAARPDIYPGLANLIVAALGSRHDSPLYAVRVAVALGLGNDVTDAAAEAALREATGPALNREHLGTVLAALEDAADYRRDAGDCSDCEAMSGGGPCGDHEADEAMASMYDMLHGELQEHQGEAATAAGTEAGS